MAILTISTLKKYIKEKFFDNDTKLNTINNKLDDINNKLDFTSGVGGAANIGVKQTVLLDVTADAQNPYTKEVRVDTTKSFPVMPMNVMRIAPGTQNVVNVLADFDSTDSNDFEDSEYIEFDGKLQLKTKYYKDAQKTISYEDSSVYELELDLDNYKSMNGIEVL